MTRPTDIDEGFSLSDRPIRKNIIATASHGFHIFHAHTANLWLQHNNKRILDCESDKTSTLLRLKYAGPALNLID